MYTGRGRRGAGRSPEKLTYLGRQSWHGQTEFTKELIKFLTKIYFNKSVCAPLQRTRLTPVIALFIFVSSPPPSGHDRSEAAALQSSSCSNPDWQQFPLTCLLSPAHIYSGLFLDQLLFIRLGYIYVSVWARIVYWISPPAPLSPPGSIISW